MRACVLPMMVGVAGCASGAAQGPYDAILAAATPTERPIAASVRVLSCVEDDAEARARCETCDVTVHANDDGVLANATHWEHDLKPWEDGGPMKVTISGEAAYERFASTEANLVEARRVFSEAEGWCAQRGEGAYYLLKDEIAAELGVLGGEIDR